MLIDFRQLFPRWNINPTGVLHVGANIGEEAPVYDELGIKKMIFLEAHPETYKKLRDNIKRFPGASAVEVCVSDKDLETVYFNVSNNGSQSSSILEFGTHAIVHPEVKFIDKIQMLTWRVDTLLKGVSDLSDFDFLNIDLQGAELKALRGMGDLLRQFKWAYLEVNQAELYKGCPHVNDLDLFLTGFHFERVETRWAGNTGWGDALYIKR